MFRRKIDILLQEKDGKTVFRVGQWMEMTEFEVLLVGAALFCEREGTALSSILHRS